MTFWSAALSSLSVNCLAEIGDKTFFVAALLAVKRKNRWWVWLGASMALWVQGALACSVGYLIHHSRSSTLSSSFWGSLRWDYLLGGICLIVSGSLGLYEVCHEDDDDDGVDVLSASAGDVEGQTFRSYDDAHDDLHASLLMEEGQYYAEEEEDHEPPPNKPNSANTSATTAPSSVVAMRDEEDIWVDPANLSRSRRRSQISLRHAQTIVGSTVAAKQKSSKNTTIFLEALVSVFLAELGDRSMFTTVALATSLNPWGVLLGCIIAYGVVNVAAVCSTFLAEAVPERALAITASALLIAFGLSSLYEFGQPLIRAP